MIIPHLKNLINTYRPVLIFVGLFFSTYIAMSLLYGAYLNYYASATGTADPITNLVAIQSTALINSFGYDAQILPDTSAPHMKLIINDHYTANIIEGCNALSIIILFISFILAFAQGFKKTFLFLLAGTSLIYAVNLVRICILAIALYKYPNQSDFLHGVVFPGIIYGMVFLLWVLWIRVIKKQSK
ncbi:exosortase family protein XrtF [Patiriisocius marinus]|uniref:exosortase family protein XrtF n=1 Tax=Patiriisocius marinus TaxID=1397112 RepID=UPI00232EEF68|nr:exosortase family protein XrtF [Patiriisocius marinus]